MLGVRKMSAKLSSLERTERKRGAKPQGLRRGRKRLDGGGGVGGGSRAGSGARGGLSGGSAGRADGWNRGSRSLWRGAPGRWTVVTGSALCSGVRKLVPSLAKPSAGGLGPAMSSSITTSVGWRAWSPFREGPSSGPRIVFARRFKVGGDRWVWLRGCRHRCSGSGGLACEDHAAGRGGETGAWLCTGSWCLLWRRAWKGSSPGTRGTLWAAITSSNTTARTRREAFSRGEGVPRGCSLGRFGLLSPHSVRARGCRHRLDWPGRLASRVKSMGEAAAPRGPWGLPGCSLG